MLSLEQRAQAVIDKAWSLLPPIKKSARFSRVILQDLGAINGQYNDEEGLVFLNRRLFLENTFSNFQDIDDNGNAPARADDRVSLALHTALHELMHAIGSGTGLDMRREWLGLSDWRKDSENIGGFGRYVENRPGWKHETSKWRYKAGKWFARPYSSKSPHEDFADAGTWKALGWTNRFSRVNGKAKLLYINTEVWQDTPARIFRQAFSSRALVELNHNKMQ